MFFFLLLSHVNVERVKSNNIQQNLGLSLETHFVNVTRNANLQIASNKMQCNEKGKQIKLNDVHEIFFFRQF